MTIYDRKEIEYTKMLIELVSLFIEVAGYKIDLPKNKSLECFSTCNKQLEIELIKYFHSKITSKM